MCNWTRWTLPALVILASLGPGARSAPPSAANIEFFEKKIRPVLVENCHKCHGAAKQKGKLQLDSRAAMLKGGETGPAIVPGEPAKSLLLKAIGYKDPDLRMPPKGKLADEHLADFTAWV